MKILNAVLFLNLLSSEITFAKSVQFVKSWSLPSSYKVDGLQVGGLSGCVKQADKLHFISDDRGSFGGSRRVTFSWDAIKTEIIFDGAKNLLIENDNKNKTEKKILDLEGIALNSKNEFLVSNEGDANKKPRQPAEIFWVDNTGKRLRNIELPDLFITNLTGQQGKGLQNNLGFEGLNIDLTLNKWGAFAEAPVFTSVNKLADHIEFIESDMNSLKVDQTYSYPLPVFEGSAASLMMGVTEFLYLNDIDLLVLERGLEFTMQGIQFDTQLCFVKKDKNQKLTKECNYVFNNDQKLLKAIGRAGNFEGLCWLNEKKTQFLVVSDNNFSKKENTVFLLYDIK